MPVFTLSPGLRPFVVKNVIILRSGEFYIELSLSDRTFESTFRLFSGARANCHTYIVNCNVRLEPLTHRTDEPNLNKLVFLVFRIRRNRSCNNRYYLPSS